MNNAAWIVLIVAWIVWVSPFIAYKARTPKRNAQVTVHISRWGIGLQMIAYFLAWSGGPRLAAVPAAQVTGILFACLGVVLSWTAIRNLGKQLRIEAGLYADHELVRSGPYRVVRHPIYAGMLAMYLATALIWTPRVASAVIGLVLMIAGIEIRLRAEDSLLASRFGKQFEVYRTSTAAYLPFVR
jgi:protein-S-isoprenylcysteine O-methyltransferase Ste14